MKMLQLTENTTGYTIYVNPAHIISFYRNKISTIINTTNDKLMWYVKESPEDIMAMLKREGER